MSDQDDRWLERHGLERDPFPEADSGGEFFARGGRERLLETLADPAGQGRSLVAVVGDAGVGKTVMFHALLRQLPADARLARVTAGVFLSAKSLLAAVARALGAEVDADASRPELRRAARERIESIVGAGGHCFVLVDDAGELEADALDELVQLAELEPSGARLRVVLFALPGIRDALGKASGGQRVGPLLQEALLERYSLNELRGYLQFRLARAGLKGASPFSEEAYAEIFRRSQGVPGRANAVAARMLRSRGPGLPRRQLYFAATGVAAALALAALLLVLFGGGDDSEMPSRTGVEDVPPPEPLATPALETPRPATLTAEQRAEAGEWIEPDAARPAPAEGAAEAAVVGAAAPAPAAPAPSAPRSSAAADDATIRTSGPAEGRPAAASGEARTTLEAMDPDHYLLQVLVNSTPDRARDFIAAREDAGAYRFYERVRDGTPQYVVVYGDFATRGEARRAIARVARATGLSPWVRGAADVQAELERR